MPTKQERLDKQQLEITELLAERNALREKYSKAAKELTEERYISKGLEEDAKKYKNELRYLSKRSEEDAKKYKLRLDDKSLRLEEVQSDVDELQHDYDELVSILDKANTKITKMEEVQSQADRAYESLNIEVENLVEELSDQKVIINELLESVLQFAPNSESIYELIPIGTIVGVKLNNGIKLNTIDDNFLLSLINKI